MRRVPFLLSLALLSGGLVAAPGGASGLAGAAISGGNGLAQHDPGVGGFMSPNVSYVGTIPLDSPGVGGRVLQVGDQVRFYVTGLKGLTVYDVTDPALPLPLGVFAYPHSQNEDVDVSDDGKRVIISADGSLLLPIMPATRGVHVIDTSDPANMALLGSHSQGSHTTTCADPACEWLYTSNGSILDATNPASITEVGRWKPTSGSAHALNRDEAGIVISDSNPRFVLDPAGVIAPTTSFHEPAVLSAGGRVDALDNRLQHNNVRPRATEWTPRAAEDAGDGPLRPGELLIGNSESNLNQFCSSAGGLSTWSMANFDRGEPITQIESFRPVSGTWADGNAAVNGLGCSGHWFTERDNIITAAWYEHGIRFVEVDPESGELTEVGYFQPVATEAGAAHWVDDEYVYTVDYARGIDILRFDRGGELPSEENRLASWLSTIGQAPGPLAERERYICSLALRD